MRSIQQTINYITQTFARYGIRSGAPDLASNANLANKLNKREYLKPMFKWTGGKRKEIKAFEKFFPDFVKMAGDYTYVEPFVGAGAVYFYLNNTYGSNIINDFDPLVMNFYKQFRNGNKELDRELKRISQIVEHSELEAEYYKQRNLDKDMGLAQCSDTQKAIRFFTVNQLAFSGMRRFNSDGEFNVPFGHYKGLNANVLLSKPHFKLLNKTECLTGDFEQVMKKYDLPNTFHFLDPPYTRVFKEYSANNSFGEDDQRRLASTIAGMNNAKVMMIIDKSDFTMGLYSKSIKAAYPLRYGVNIKNRFNQEVEHLIVCNY